MHGTPGARRQIPLEARTIADQQGLRIIGVDRPGIGRRRRTSTRTSSTGPATSRFMLDTLGIGRSGLIALWAAARTRRRPAPRCRSGCTALGVLGGVAPTGGEDAVDGG